MPVDSSIAKNNQRVWEIDALRGIMILILLCYHLYYTVWAFCINGYYQIDSYAYVNASDPLHFWYDWGEDGVIYMNFLTAEIREIWRVITIDTFFVVSGISCMFSRNGLKRGLTTLGAGLFVAAFTYGLAYWTGDPTRFIRWGVLMCYASCQLLYHFLLKKKSNETLFVIAAIALAVGYYLRYHGIAATKLPIFYIFGVPQIGDQSSDYWPILPMLGWFLLGVVLGRKYYPEKKTLLPYPVVQKLTRPLQWMGRYSGIIYVSHIVVYTVVFCGVGYLLHLL